ncbi:hypothetical protein DPV78_003373 [Talaromyces pinophilus]|nr:hypothetical protein DPV78_003373 [Talaromyces pinophilus]
MGKIVRLGPREISVNCVDNGIKAIFGKGFEKTQFYSIFENYGYAYHSKATRLEYVFIFTDCSTCDAKETIIWEITYQRLLPQFSKVATLNDAKNVYPIYKSVAMDITTSYFFGLTVGTRFHIDEKAQTHWQGLYFDDQRPTSLFFLQELPRHTSWLGKVGIDLVPERRHNPHAEVAACCLQMSDGAERVLSQAQAGHQPKLGYRPVVYERLKRGLEKDCVSQEAIISQSLTAEVEQALDEKIRRVLQQKRSWQQLEISNELLNQLIATNGTIGTTLLYVTWNCREIPVS